MVRTKPPLVITAQGIEIRANYRWGRPGVPGVGLWTTTPIEILACPVGHYWARIASNYLGSINHSRRESAYCPDHQAEKAQNHSQKASLPRKWARDYDNLPLPATRRCLGPKPQSHEPGAILPISQFYLRSGSPRKDGTRATHVNARCKRCEIEAVTERRKSLSSETINRWQRAHRKNRAQRAKEIQNKSLGDRRVDNQLFLEWAHWIQPEYTATEARLIARSKQEGNRIPYWIVDAVMTRYGATDQLAVFYP